MKLWKKISLLCGIILALTVAACTYIQLIETRNTMVDLTCERLHQKVKTLENGFPQMVNYFGSETDTPAVERSLLEYCFSRLADSSCALIVDGEPVYYKLKIPLEALPAFEENVGQVHLVNSEYFIEGVKLRVNLPGEPECLIYGMVDITGLDETIRQMGRQFLCIGVAVRFPSDRIAQELILAAGGYVAAPSANTSGRPSPTTAQHVEEDLGGAIDMIIDGGQVGIGLESTIVDFTEEIPVVLRPGYISLEMLQELLGEVKMDKGLLITDNSVRPKAPGMKYRHYAPKADLAIVEGETEAVIRKITALAKEAEAEGKKVGIIATDETMDRYPKACIIKSIGSREEEETIAHHLYEVLREFDEGDAKVIYSEAFYTPRMGQAIMNRLLKAAGHKRIQAE